jgi:integrase
MCSDIPEFDSAFRDDLRGYVVFKRSLGYKYGGPTVARLQELGRFLAAAGADGGGIGEELFESWSARRPGEGKANRAKRISTLNNFCRYLAGLGRPGVHVCEYPAGTWDNSFTPYIFTHEQIAALFAAAKRARSAPGGGRDADATAVLLCLYYGCGLRKSEALGLKLGDLDLSGRTLKIIGGKNGTSRVVALSESVAAALARHTRLHCLGDDRDAPVFADSTGRRLSDSTLYNRFHALLAAAGIPRREGRRGPRIQDLRHTFCVHTLERIDANGYDMYANAPVLSAYLGHKTLRETEYYLRLVEANFRVITDKSALHAPDLYPKLRGGHAR